MTHMIMTHTIVESIAAGEYDAALSQILIAAKERQQSLRSSRKVSDFGIGDVVRFNDFCGTKYLHGHQATVVGIRAKRLVVKLKNPIGKHATLVDGKWEGSQVVVPPSIIDLVN